jgi:hypothetical protein
LTRRRELLRLAFNSVTPSSLLARFGCERIRLLWADSGTPLEQKRVPGEGRPGPDGTRSARLFLGVLLRQPYQSDPR